MYQSFQSFQSFLGFLFACFTVYTVIKALNLDHLLDPFRDLWERLSKTGRILTTVSVVFLAGYAISKERGVRNLGPNLPDWFVALNYNTADTDGDGIPDCWERWTRTNPLVADAEQDRDGDGVDNFGEFWNQCDPLMKDTDGDGYSDKLEIEGKAAGKTWFDPIIRATYDYNDPDCNTNGVPDRWEGLGYVYGFTDANGDGLPDGVSFPESGNGTFDVEVIVSTTRAALLSWGASTNEAIVLPPCSCLPVRLRLSGYADTDVRLSCGTAGDGSEGLWYGRLVIRWPEGSEQETESDRIRIESDAVIECEAMEVSFRGEVQTEPTRTPGDVPTSITSPFRRKWINVFGISGGCWEHDTNGVAAVAFYTNVAPPFVWYFGDGRIDGYHDDFLPIGAFPTNEEGDVQVSCEWVGGTPHQTIRVIGSTSFRLDHCPPDTTNLYPISDLVGFDVITNHAPDRIDNPTDNSGNCPKTHHWSIWAGYAHSGEKPWERNFETIPTGFAQDDETSHCHAIDWSENLEIDLEEYLPSWLLDYKDKIEYCINGKVAKKSTVSGGSKPKDLIPNILHVELKGVDGTTYDRLWVVVLAPETRVDFNNWASANTTNATWLGLLPQPPSKLIVNATGEASLPPAASANWNAPEPFPANSYMHPKAVYELRSKPISGGHGHQATYDAEGKLITDSIKSGTADFATPSPKIYAERLANHRSEDVKPYIRALQLDGNPVWPVDSSGEMSTFWTRNLSRPPLHIGPFTRQYLQRRPTTPTGVLIIP